MASVGLQSHSQCQQQPSGSMTRTGVRLLEQVGMGGGLHSTSTSSTVLLCLQTAMVQLHSHHVSFSCRRRRYRVSQVSRPPSPRSRGWVVLGRPWAEC